MFLDLVAAERRGRRVALPVTTTRVAEQVCRFHGVEVEWVTTAPDSIVRAAPWPDLAGGGDGRGGFVVPEVGPAIDGNAAFLRLLGLVARTRLTPVPDRRPHPHRARAPRRRRDPVGGQGQVMRAVVEAAGDRTARHHRRCARRRGRRALGARPARPRSRRSPTCGPRAAPTNEAADLLEEWSAVVGRAGR